MLKSKIQLYQPCHSRSHY